MFVSYALSIWGDGERHTARAELTPDIDGVYSLLVDDPVAFFLKVI
jgi:hypothetical protein